MRPITWCLWLLLVPGAALGERRPPGDTIEARLRGQLETARGREAAHDDPGAQRAYEQAQLLRPSAFGLLLIARSLDRQRLVAAATARYNEFLAHPSADPIDAARVRLRIAALRAHDASERPLVAVAPRHPEQKPPLTATATAERGPTRPEPTGRNDPPPTPGTSMNHEGQGSPTSSSGAGLRISAALLTFLAVGAIGGGSLLQANTRREYVGLHLDCRDACAAESWQPAAIRDHASWALIMAGGVLAATDIVLWSVWGARRRNEGRAWVAPSVGGIVLGGTFQ